MNMNMTQENLNEFSGVDCSICLEELNNGEKNRLLHCGHVFHTACIEPWIKTNFTCPYCRQCEANIDCYWLSLRDFGLSWLNKIRKYKYTLKKTHIEISRKKNVYRINLYFIRRIFFKNNTIVFFFIDGKKTTLLFKNAHPPFIALKQMLNDYYKRQQQEIQRQQQEIQRHQQEIQRQHIQHQIQQIRQMQQFRPIQAWVEETQSENDFADANNIDDDVENLD